MDTKRVFSLAIALVAVIALSGVCFADSYHYKNILIGERAAGLAGAYTAISDDPSGMYYNPAGIMYASGSGVSAGANAYHNTTKTYKGAIGGQDWKRKASTLLPNFFGVIQQLGEGRLGISYVVPDSVIEDQDQTFYNIPSNVDINGDTVNDPINEMTVNFNNEDNTYNLGLTYARDVSEDMALGMTLYFHKRRIQQIMNQYLDFGGGVTHWDNYYYESEETGIRPILGIMYSPREKWSLGASLSKIIVLDAANKAQRTLHAYDGSTNLQPGDIVTSSEKREYPVVLSLGAAYFHSDTFLVSGDVSYHSSEKDEVDGERIWVLNAALGIEKYLNASTAIRAGVYTNMSSAPELERGVSSAYSEEHVDLYGSSLSYTKFGRGSSLTLGLAYSVGSGESQITGDSTSMQEMEVKSYTVFLSNSYSF
jgi:long-chain fatty acid transport protein